MKGMNKGYRKRLCKSILALILTITVIGVQAKGVLHAEDKEKSVIPGYAVAYAEDGKSAEIKFDLEQIDETKYEVKQLISEENNDVLYDREAGDSDVNKALSYKVTSNGTYKFKVLYEEVPAQETDGETAEGDSGSEPEKSFDVEIGDIGKEPEKSDQTEQEDQAQKDETGKEGQEAASEAGQEESQEESQEADQIQPGIADLPDLAAMGLKSGGSHINLDGQFVMTQRSYTSTNFVEIEGPKNFAYILPESEGTGVLLADSKTAWDMEGASVQSSAISQLTIFTSKYQLDFKKSWSLKGFYGHPFVADGFAIAFHDTKGYSPTGDVANARLGVYGPYGLQKGLVLEIDSFGYNDFGDSNNDKKAGAHMQIMQAYGGLYPPAYTDPIPLASGTEENPVSPYFGTNLQPFGITYNAATMTLTWTYGGAYGAAQQTQTLAFTGEQDIRDKIGSMTPYYTLSCSMNYTARVPGNFGSPSSGRTVLVMQEFKYTGVEPSLSTTYYSLVKKDGNVVGLGYDFSSGVYGKGGDTIRVRHCLKNSTPSSSGIQDDVSLRAATVINGYRTELAPVAGSAKYYLEGGIKQNLPDDIFGKGTKITYPANSVGAYVEYDVKIPDDLVPANKYTLQTDVTLGTSGMSQKDYSPDLELLSRPRVTSNSRVLDNQYFNCDSTKTSLSTAEAAKLFFENIKLKKCGGDERNLTNYVDLLSNEGFFSNASKGLLFDGMTIKNQTFKGGTEEGVAPANASLRDLGMYYNVMEIYDTRFAQGYEGTTNANGVSSVLRRVWICDNHAESGGLYGISKNMEIDESSLSAMTDNELKDKILTHVKIYNETAEKNELYNKVSGNLKAELKSVGPADITVGGFSTGSPASETPYNATITALVNGRTIAVPIKITVVDPSVSSYVVIPKTVELKSDAGIKTDYIGEKAKVELVGAHQTTAKQILVQADTGFKLQKDNSSDAYTVDLYDTEKQKLPSVNSIAEVGTLSSAQNKLEVWFNAKKAAVDRGAYKGTMKFYISFK